MNEDAEQFLISLAAKNRVIEQSFKENLLNEDALKKKIYETSGECVDWQRTLQEKLYNGRLSQANKERLRGIEQAIIRERDKLLLILGRLLNPKSDVKVHTDGSTRENPVFADRVCETDGVVTPPSEASYGKAHSVCSKHSDEDSWSRSSSMVAELDSPRAEISSSVLIIPSPTPPNSSPASEEAVVHSNVDLERTEPSVPTVVESLDYHAWIARLRGFSYAEDYQQKDVLASRVYKLTMYIEQAIQKREDTIKKKTSHKKKSRLQQEIQLLERVLADTYELLTFTDDRNPICVSHSSGSPLLEDINLRTKTFLLQKGQFYYWNPDKRLKISIDAKLVSNSCEDLRLWVQSLPLNQVTAPPEEHMTSMLRLRNQALLERYKSVANDLKGKPSNLIQAIGIMMFMVGATLAGILLGTMGGITPLIFVGAAVAGAVFFGAGACRRDMSRASVQIAATLAPKL